MGRKMNEYILISCSVIVCKVREGVDNDLGQFVLVIKQAFACNSLILDGNLSNTRCSVPVDSLTCF